MTSRRKVSLAEKQLEMLKRNRPQRVRRLTVAETERLRRRIAGTILLRKGFTVELLAVALKVNVDSVRRWQAEGCPLL